MDAGLNETRMKMLGELAEMGLVLARDLQQSALVATDAEEKVKLATAFHRIGRGVRQSLALHAKFERDAERDLHEAEAEARQRRKAHRDQSRDQVRARVERLIWTEADRPDSDLDGDDLVRDLDLLIAEADPETFDHPDTLIAQLCETLRISPPPRGEGAGGGGASPGLSVEPQAPPPQGEVSAQRTEGVEAHEPHRSALQPPQSLRDSSPSGGAAGSPSPPRPSG